MPPFVDPPSSLLRRACGGAAHRKFSRRPRMAGIGQGRRGAGGSDAGLSPLPRRATRRPPFGAVFVSGLPALSRESIASRSAFYAVAFSIRAMPARRRRGVLLLCRDGAVPNRASFFVGEKNDRVHNWLWYWLFDRVVVGLVLDFRRGSDSTNAPVSGLRVQTTKIIESGTSLKK